MTIAESLAYRTAGLSAFNLTAWERGNVVTSRRNQSGRLLVFNDGSRAFIPAGTATVNVKR